uniref:Uncharacterized protein n=1 Tax=Rhizophora mucronata TaxID=61149 RepID=A0A2P2QQX9_RHIMU
MKSSLIRYYLCLQMLDYFLVAGIKFHSCWQPRQVLNSSLILELNIVAT